MIVADTSAMVALLDRGARDHDTLRDAYELRPGEWILPWAILPELDYIAAARLGRGVAAALREDLARGKFTIEWGRFADLQRAEELNVSYRSLRLGLVDGVVMAVAERLRARAIATVDLGDFGAVSLEGQPQLWPRDL
ncbi:PIN domain-containing protein [Candidatus Palauibacter polyketidifaciens]|uniref:type II toxin-antitoxin system VapC family toxin n=1 Tax=Candidatus Palauibacter polyketidifaciens TaxID=3056740 RepID=UPI00239313D1|nr:PIN domain-containing protein [Candidatus Palauibacter polyketidifaciens]MDE2721489.1 PIN domain-containing protein [Candidatus Palauibacter polyketidifaciens]